MGGFGNKFGKGAVGPQVGLSNIGSGFAGMPKFDLRKKMMAMRGSSRPVFSNARNGKGGPIGKGSFSQAKAIKSTQHSYTGTDVDANRSTQDKAWGEGTTEGGVGNGGAGLSGAGSGGGSGIVTSPALDNGGGGGGGGRGGNPVTVGDPNLPDSPDMPDEPVIPEPTMPTNVSPWASMVKTMMTLLMLSAVLAALGAVFVNMGKVPATSYMTLVGQIVCGIAAALGAAVMVMGLMLMSQFGQAMMSMVYILGGACAVAGAMIAMGGGAPTSIGGILSKMIGVVNPLYLIGGAAVCGMIGGMMAGPTAGGGAEKLNEAKAALSDTKDKKAAGSGPTTIPPDSAAQQQRERDREMANRSNIPIGSSSGGDASVVPVSGPVRASN